MDEFARFIALYGNYIIIAFVLLCFEIFLFIGRKNTYFLPKGFLAWTADIILIMLVSLAISTGILVQTQISPLKSVFQQTNEPAPDLTFQLVDSDSTMNLNNYKGKVVLLNFWATWCGPCMEEIPELNRLQETYESKGLVVITISDEKRSHLQKYFEENPWNFVKGYLNPKIWSKGPYRKIQEIRPVSFIINRNGIIKQSLVGAHTYAQLQTIVQKYLNS